MFDARSVRSYSEIAGKEALTRARVTQIMNLLKFEDPHDSLNLSSVSFRRRQSGRQRMASKSGVLYTPLKGSKADKKSKDLVFFQHLQFFSQASL